MSDRDACAFFVPYRGVRPNYTGEEVIKCRFSSGRRQKERVVRRLIAVSRLKKTSDDHETRLRLIYNRFRIRARLKTGW